MSLLRGFIYSKHLMEATSSQGLLLFPLSLCPPKPASFPRVAAGSRAQGPHSVPGAGCSKQADTRCCAKLPGHRTSGWWHHAPCRGQTIRTEMYYLRCFNLLLMKPRLYKRVSKKKPRASFSSKATLWRCYAKPARSLWRAGAATSSWRASTSTCSAWSEGKAQSTG